MALGVLELTCMLGLVVPVAFHWHPILTVASAAVLAIECLLFVWVHLKYKEIAAVALSTVLGILMAFIAYGRSVIHI
jgi:glycopeptide antibiotics resistance protein